MFLAIDVGATKTLLAVFSKEGKLLQEQKIDTAQKYGQFLDNINAVFKSEKIRKDELSACCCGLPGRLDRENGMIIGLGNLDWSNVPIRKDLESIVGNIPTYIENDANLAGIAEAQIVLKKYKKVLYITLSTGVGGSLITNGVIDADFLDFEPGKMILEHEGKLQEWEDFASGRALVERFGKKAEQLDNPFAWKKYSQGVARGLDVLLAVLMPDVVIIGGGVGSHLEKFSNLLHDELKKHQRKVVPIPPIIKAHKPEEAVVYGCYEYLKQNN